jgi:methylenetetrahydrofolate dehydrogenase (NADP+)/methenyltetrahydrofolate cyclohydrolase
MEDNMTKIIDGKEVSKKIKEDLKIEVDNLKKQGIYPKLSVIMVGEDPSSKIYVKSKSKACEEVGIEYEEYLLSSNIKMDELLDLIISLNNRKDICGILLQSPIPKGLDIDKAFRTISSKKDVDGFNPENVGKLCLGHDTFISCTPFGVMKLLEYYGIEVEGKNAVVIGRSNIVGKPMLQCLLNADATVTICHSKTKNLEEISKKADIIVSAIGKPNFITENMIKQGAVVIDVGINRKEDSKICGDVDFERASKKASYITPVPRRSRAYDNCNAHV